ncbi:MAG: hypothetical protein KHZ82_03075 [Peptoniphilus harei]|nr:hypothetical protein [Peptoniphilus harei]
MSEDNNKCVISEIIEMIKKAFLKAESSVKKNLGKILRICSFIIFLIFIIVILIILTILIIRYKTLNFDPLAKVLSALIAAAGVFEGFRFNKKQTYKEIVTKERIEWLHKMQDNLSEYLLHTKPNYLMYLDRDRINKLYYEIIFNINHKNDKDAYNAIKNYNSLVLGELEKIRVNLAIKEGVKLELVAVAGEEGELLFKIKDESERNKIEGLIVDRQLENILIAEDKDENKNKDEKELPKEISLLREEVSEEFTEIFKAVWTHVKKEAD